MSKFDEALETYKKEMTKLNITWDDDLLKSVTKSLGPSIYNNDASKVSSSDKTELDRVKTNFINKKLGVTDDAAIETAITKVVEQFGSSNPNKYRAIFYYLLAKEFKKEEIFA